MGFCDAVGVALAAGVSLEGACTTLLSFDVGEGAVDAALPSVSSDPGVIWDTFPVLSSDLTVLTALGVFAEAGATGLLCPLLFPLLSSFNIESAARKLAARCIGSWRR